MLHLRELNGIPKFFVQIYCVFASLFHFYTAGFGTFPPREQRSIHLLFLIPIIYLLFPANKEDERQKKSIPWYDLLLAVGSFISSAYIYRNAFRIDMRIMGITEITHLEVILGTVIIIAVVETGRRALSVWYAVTTLFFFSYLFISPYLPGIFYFRGYSFTRIVEMMYLFIDEGIYGFLTGISTNILYIYVLFAIVMVKCGVADYIIDFAQVVAGGLRGGPAKIAVVSSAFYGSVSGSTIANVYATGSISIPLMKKIGYRPQTAAAIEAISSTGGQWMPPIMGAGAFVMAELTGISYLTIIKVAIIPAVLYYIGVMMMVHLEALRLNIGTIKEKQIESKTWSYLLKRIYLISPFFLIIYFLYLGYSPSRSAYYVILVTLVLALLTPEVKVNLKKIWEVLYEGALSAAMIAVALANAGIIVTVLTRTGLAIAFSSMVVRTARGNLFLVLIFTFLAVTVLGKGIPTTAAYVICVTIAAPALGRLGIEVLIVHFFVFYFGVLSDITPPVAVTSFAAATLSGSDMMKTGFEGFKLALAGFLIPFVFVYRPALLWRGPLYETLLVFVLAAYATVLLASVIIGYSWWGPVNRYQRIGFLLVSFLLVFPAYLVNVIGLILSAGFLYYLYLQHKKRMARDEVASFS